jgi:hypothetical protein
MLCKHTIFILKKKRENGKREDRKLEDRRHHYIVNELQVQFIVHTRHSRARFIVLQKLLHLTSYILPHFLSPRFLSSKRSFPSAHKHKSNYDHHTPNQYVKRLAKIYLI